MKIEGSVVLVVDDDRSIGTALLSLMRACGVKSAEWADDGQTALAVMARGYNPDFIITDLKMKFMNGMDLTKRIRLADKRLPIIMLTAEDSQKQRQAAKQAGVNVCLQKPFNLDDLLAAIAKL